MPDISVDCSRCGYVFQKERYRELKVACLRCAWDTEQLCLDPYLGRANLGVTVGDRWRGNIAGRDIWWVWDGVEWLREDIYKKRRLRKLMSVDAAERAFNAQGKEPKEDLDDWELRIKRMLE